MGAIINPNIALGYKPPQFQITDPVQAIANVYSLKNLMTEGDLKALQIQQAQQQLEMERRQMAATQAINDALQGKTPTAATTALPVAPVTPAVQPVTPTAAAATPQPATTPPVSMSDLMNLPTVDRAAQMGALAGIPSLSQTPGAALQPPPTPDALANVFPAISPPSPAAPSPAVAQPAPAPALPPSSPVGMLSRLPSDDVLLKAGGVAALPLIENLHKVRKAQLDAHISELDAGQKETQAVADLATGAIDDESLKRNLNTAGQNGYLSWDQVRHYTQLGFDAPATQAFLKSVQNQALGAKNVQEMRLANAEALRKEMEFGPTLSEKTANAAVAQQQADAMLLSSVARQDPSKLPQVKAAIGPQRAAPFANLTDPDQIMSQGQKPQEYIQAAEAKRHNLSTEEMAGVNAAISAGKLAQTRRVNDIEYGPGQAQYWVQQIYENPDTVNSIPEKLKTPVLNLFRQTYNLPLPKQLDNTSLQQEAASKSTLGDITWIRNALKNPNIANNIGPILGNIQNVEQTTGIATGLTGADAQMAQEFRTRMRNMLANEAGAMHARINPKTMDDLAKSSGRVNMNVDMLQGALNGVEGYANNRLEGFERQRFGGQMRPPDARGVPGAVSSDVKTLLSDPKVAPGIHTLSNGQKFMKSADGTITPAQ